MEALSKRQRTAEDLEQLARRHSSLELKKMGYTAGELKSLYSLEKLVEIRVPSGEHGKSVPVFTPKELLDAGISLQDLCWTPPFTYRPLCSPSELIEAGVEPRELKAAGVTAFSHQKAGIKITDLIGIYPLKELCGAFQPSELVAAGFSLVELKNADVSLMRMKFSGYAIIDDLKEVFTLKELCATENEYSCRGVFPLRDLLASGFDICALKEAGVPSVRFKEEGFLTADISNVYSLPGADLISFRLAGVSAAAMKKVWCIKYAFLLSFFILK